MGSARWALSHRFDRRALPLADRHYNRRKIGSPQFVPPGRCLVLLTPCERALWVTSWPFALYVRHAWAGAWVCSLFRREDGAPVASALIVMALAATRWVYGEPPDLGLVTFLDPDKVRPTKVRGEDVYGWTWLKAGFEPARCPRHWPDWQGVPCADPCSACHSRTEGGLLAFQIQPDRIPEAVAPIGAQLEVA